MKFVSWSGGKDCSFALYKYLQSGADDVRCLLNMDRNNPRSGHQVSHALFEAQANNMGLELVREKVNTDKGYLYHFDRAILALKEKGYDGGVFGDLYLQVHREWIEAQCDRLGIEAIFPLWEMSVHDIYKEVVDSGFVTKIIGVAKPYKELLGLNLTAELYPKLLAYDNFDVCGENGEYHSFVLNSPLYKKEINYKVVDHYENEKLFGLSLDINEE